MLPSLLIDVGWVPWARAHFGLASPSAAVDITAEVESAPTCGRATSATTCILDKHFTTSHDFSETTYPIVQE